MANKTPAKPALKIGLVLDDSLDSSDGVQQYVLAVGRWLAQQGHEVHYLVGETKRTDIPDIHSLSRNIKVRFNGNHMSMPLPASKRHIRQLLQENGFDILHVQMPYSPFLASRILRAAPTSTAVIGTFHIAPYSRTVIWGNRLLSVLLRRSLRRFNEVVSVSPIAQQFARQVFNINSTVVPNAVELAAYRQAVPLDKFNEVTTIVFLGRLMERKGCRYLLEAINYVQANRLTNKQYYVIIIGKGPLEPQLREYVQQHNLSDFVMFTGFVSESDKPRYLASSDIAIFPSTGGESFGIVLVEALAASRGVVLAGDNPGYASVMQPFPDSLFNPTDTPALAKKLVYFIENSSERQKQRAKQQIAALQYDVGQVGRRLLNHYRTALHKQRS